MTKVVSGLFNFADRLAMSSLDQRLKRAEVISSNIANAETPGFRAIGYSFEEQMQALVDANHESLLKTTHDKHFRHELVQGDGTIKPDVYVRPTESIPEDGNTVDIDYEMAQLAQNQILYRAAVELLNRKVGILRYAITNGGR